VNENILDVTYLSDAACIDTKELPQKRALANVLRDMGFSQVDGRRIKVGANHHYVWFKRAQSLDSEGVKAVVREWYASGPDLDDVPF